MNKGSVLRVSGTIIDVQFPRESAPDILNELLIEFPDHDGKRKKSKHRSCATNGRWHCSMHRH